MSSNGTSGNTERPLTKAKRKAAEKQAAKRAARVAELDKVRQKRVDEQAEAQARAEAEEKAKQEALVEAERRRAEREARYEQQEVIRQRENAARQKQADEVSTKAFEDADHYVSGFFVIATLVLGLRRLQPKAGEEPTPDAPVCPHVDPYLMEEMLFPSFPQCVPDARMFDLSAIVSLVPYKEYGYEYPEFWLVRSGVFEIICIDYTTAKKAIADGARVFGKPFPSKDIEAIHEAEAQKEYYHNVIKPYYEREFGGYIDDDW